MFKYPLYDELQRQVNEKEKETSMDISYVSSTINAISTNYDFVEHYEEIEALILKYELSTNSNVLLTMTPFSGKVLPGNKGVLTTLSNLPAPLLKIIVQYIEHYSK